MDFNTQRSKKGIGTRVNEQIKVPKVLLIDNSGNNIGETNTYTALQMARDAQLDLVEVNPNDDPPVCKIMDYSKFIYEQKKKLRKNRMGKAKDLKEFRFSVVIDEADMNTKIKKASEFLEKGHPVKITVTRKGRQPYDRMKEVFSRILTNFTKYSSIESEHKIDSNSISITLKGDGKTKNEQNSSKESQTF